MKYLYFWRTLKVKTMKKLLLLLMIVPIIGLSQEFNCLDSLHTGEYSTYDAEAVMIQPNYVFNPTPEELINLMVCAAENNEFTALEYVVNSSAYPCEHIVEFRNLLTRASGLTYVTDELGLDSITDEPLSNREIKALNGYIEKYSGKSVAYVSPLISFAGKQYVKVALFDVNGGVEEGSVLFEKRSTNSNHFDWIFHTKDQKLLHKFFKKDKNWRLDRYPKK